MTSAMNPSEIFRQEAADLLTTLETTLLDLEASPEDRDLIDQAFCCLHTLKGSGAMFGWEALAAFTHHIENAFQKVRDGVLAASHDLVSLTLAALDHIQALLEQPEQADRVRGDALLAALADLTAVASDRSASSKMPSASGKSKVGQPGDVEPERVFRIHWRPGRDLLALGGNPLLLLDELRSLGSCAVTPLTDQAPTLEDLDPTGCYLAWDIILTTRIPRTAIDDVFIFVADQSELTIDEISAAEDALPRLGEILVKRGDINLDDVEAGLSQQQRLGALLVQSGKVSEERLASALGEQRHLHQAAKARESSASSSTIRVPAERLDNLMDQVSELVIAQARLQQTTANTENPPLKSIAEDIGRLVAELRDTTMSVRMLPIGTLFERFRRVVHDLSQELGKSVELTTAGEETELDKTVIESLKDPLVHLIRNAIDHGIDPAEQRWAQGKPAAGKVHLSAVHSGAQVLITIEDDGRGINRAATRAKAEERGLIQLGQEVSDAELFACIFEAGFSTAATVSNISGRGVGMDVVKRTIDSLRGSIDVASIAGKGTSITLKLPLTLAIIDGLLVRIEDERYVVPLSVVEECVELTRQEEEHSGGRGFLNLRGEIVAFIRLRHLLDVPGVAPDIQKVVVVALGESRIGLVVDQVIGQYQTVIKSLCRLHRDLEGFSGATILGDGSVALILDIPHLIKFARERETALRTA
ncbi:MAG: two-component system, chemotaxis family, sensor kinase CheA [Pseudomonadota bacterium]|nr:two-component system, chemotaxis family, sensor kinase CheA [Pseudomonadota bacterium]